MTDRISQLSELEHGYSEGTRFPYGNNFAGYELPRLISIFGDFFSKKLFDEQTPLEEWYGPLKSDMGWHYVWVSNQQQGYLPELEEIHEVVEQDFFKHEKTRHKSAKISRLISTYTVKDELGE